MSDTRLDNLPLTEGRCSRTVGQKCVARDTCNIKTMLRMSGKVRTASNRFHISVVAFCLTPLMSPVDIWNKAKALKCRAVVTLTATECEVN